jgi:hypothetical protein
MKRQKRSMKEQPAAIINSQIYLVTLPMNENPSLLQSVNLKFHAVFFHRIDV